MKFTPVLSKYDQQYSLVHLPIAQGLENPTSVHRVMQGCALAAPSQVPQATNFCLKVTKKLAFYNRHHLFKIEEPAQYITVFNTINLTRCSSKALSFFPRLSCPILVYANVKNFRNANVCKFMPSRPCQSTASFHSNFFGCGPYRRSTNL